MEGIRLFTKNDVVIRFLQFCSSMLIILLLTMKINQQNLFISIFIKDQNYEKFKV